MAGYARQGDAMLAWADICRATDSEQLCCELPVVSRIGQGKGLSLSDYGWPWGILLDLNIKFRQIMENIPKTYAFIDEKIEKGLRYGYKNGR